MAWALPKGQMHCPWFAFLDKEKVRAMWCGFEVAVVGPKIATQIGGLRHILNGPRPCEGPFDPCAHWWEPEQLEEERFGWQGWFSWWQSPSSGAQGSWQ
ncbi:MAG: hypothetical protein GY772_24730 [bacterium]|nr:hypothetical protein [bacterium]